MHRVIIQYLATVVIVSLLTLTGVDGIQFTESDRRFVDDFIEETIRCRNIPGLNIVLIKNGRVVYKRGYGVKNTETNDPVDPHGSTVFCVASNTKAFTATLLAKLLKQSKKHWSTPIRDIMGDDFKLNSEYMTSQITLKDVLSHKVGLARYDTLWFASAVKKEEIFRRLQYAKSARSFRDSFTYSNLLYGLAARVAEKLGGASYDELIRQHILIPLNMTNSHFVSDKDFHKRDDIATPYVTYNNSFKPVDVKAFKGPALNCDGALSLCSDAHDISKWMMINLGAGKHVSGKQIFHPRWITDTHTPIMAFGMGKGWDRVLSMKTWPANFNLNTYGLGWVLGNYRGRHIVYHGGSLYGYRSWMALFPDQRSGVFLSWNGDGILGKLARASITFFLMDVVLGVKPWLDANSTCQFPAPWAKHPPVTVERYTINKTITPERPLHHYTGMFFNDVFGNLTVEVVDMPNNSTNTSQKALLVKYGQMHILAYPNGVDDKFSGHTTGELWFMLSGDHLVNHGPMQICFRNLTKSNTIDEVYIPFLESSVETRFLKRQRTLAKIPSAEAVVSNYGVQKSCGTQAVSYLNASSARYSFWQHVFALLVNLFMIYFMNLNVAHVW